MVLECIPVYLMLVGLPAGRLGARREGRFFVGAVQGRAAGRQRREHLSVLRGETRGEEEKKEPKTEDAE
jgi:hypothetical protein